MECFRALFSVCFGILFSCEVAVGVGGSDERDELALTDGTPAGGFSLRPRL